MKHAITLVIIIVSNYCFAQNWIDTTFAINTISDIEYGSSIDFQGGVDVLEMDISSPINDTPPECGRPLMVIVHGGAWYGGDKNEGYPARLRRDFAKRGYVTASVNYRLGLFNSNQNVDCILEGWKCWNMTDSSEWYRANFRAVQDVNGAIRFLINSNSEYNINPDNIFLVGESAGGFIALGAGFIEDDSEVRSELIDTYPDALAPNSIYESACIQQFGLATSIDDMDLSRPNLGSFKGNLNYPAQTDFRIRGVGNFYGGAFNNIFETKSSSSPALYLHHQPCDLIVPFNYNKLVAGYNNCASGFPSFCQNIINRPFVYGSKGIANLIDTMVQNNIPTCEYLFDNSTNNYNCAQQIIDPSLGCHAIDNYWLRTTNMATFFSDYIASCSVSNISNTNSIATKFSIYPNPVRDELTIDFNEYIPSASIEVVDVLGEIKFQLKHNNDHKKTFSIATLSAGFYYILITTKDDKTFLPIVKQ